MTIRVVAGQTFKRSGQGDLWFVPVVRDGVRVEIAADRSPSDLVLVASLRSSHRRMLAAIGLLATKRSTAQWSARPNFRRSSSTSGSDPSECRRRCGGSGTTRSTTRRPTRATRTPTASARSSGTSKAPSTRFVARLAPGSRHWTSAILLRLLVHVPRPGRALDPVEVHAVVLEPQPSPGQARHPRRARLWTALASSPKAEPRRIVIPIVIENASVMSYMATNHFMRPPDRDERNARELHERHDAADHRQGPLQLQPSRRTPPVPAHERRVGARRTRVAPREHARHVREPAAPRRAAALYRTPRVYRDATTSAIPRTSPTRRDPRIETTFRAA